MESKKFTLKKCRICGVEKEATEENFHKYSRLRDGLKNECKDCVRKYNKEKGRSDEWLKMVIG